MRLALWEFAYRVWNTVANLFRRDRLESELKIEMENHLYLQGEQNKRMGMPPEKARKEAFLNFGNPNVIEEDVREAWGVRVTMGLIRTLRVAGRQLSKDKGYTVIAIVTLALGIGVNTAIYSLANAVLFQSLPFEDSERIVHLTEESKELGTIGVSYPNFVDWKKRQSSFSKIGASANSSYNLIDTEGVERIQGIAVTHDFTSVLEITPLLGRFFSEEDNFPGAEATVLLGERIWRNRYGARASMIGERINLTGGLYTIVGIVPYDFEYGDADVWTPLGLQVDAGLFPKRTARIGLRSLARLKQGVSLEQARGDMERIAADLAAEHPIANTGVSVRVERLQDVLSVGSRTTLLPLLGASGFLLLIACVNVAIMQIVRSLGRRHEFGIRISLGANRRQVLGQLLVENLALGAVGGLVALIVAYGSIEWLKSILEYRLPRIEEVGIDGDTLVYAIAVSIFSSLLFGLAPMRQAIRLSPKHALGTVAKTSASGLGKRWAVLVVCEFALTCVLLVGAGLMIRSTAKLSQSSPGFETDERFVFSWSMEGGGYDTAGKRRLTVERASEALIEIPGVERVGVAYPVPFTGERYGQTYVVEAQAVHRDSRGRSAELVWVNESYFETMGIRLVEGRLFDDFDTVDSTKVAIVDTDFSNKNFPDESPIGKRFHHGSSLSGKPKDWIQIVGVVEHVVFEGIQINGQEQMYHSIKQEIQGIPPWFSFVLKVAGASAGIDVAVRSRMGEIDSNAPVRDFGSFESKINASFARERLMMQLLGILAGLALLLAAVGLYGVLSYGVKQQTREYGIRIAIGAEPRALTWMIVKSGILLSGTGILGGLICASALSRFLGGLLYGVSEFDILTFSAVAVLLLAIGLIACWVPARRASRLAPLIALRSE